MKLELSPEDRSVLERIVAAALQELRVEVRRTSTPKYHDDMREEEGRVEGLLERIRTLDR